MKIKINWILLFLLSYFLRVILCLSVFFECLILSQTINSLLIHISHIVFLALDSPVARVHLMQEQRLQLEFNVNESRKHLVLADFFECGNFNVVMRGRNSKTTMYVRRAYGLAFFYLTLCIRYVYIYFFWFFFSVQHQRIEF